MKKISMKSRNEVIQRHKNQYKKATKKDKGKILDHVCESTRLSRNRASRLLSGEVRRKKAGVSKKRGRKKVYDEKVKKMLEKIWVLMDYSCGSRIAAGINELIDALIRFDALDCDGETTAKLRNISSSTIDRLLKLPRERQLGKGRSTTKPGTLLKRDIPIRLGTEWDENTPGFLEVDLVAHCGETAAGEYINTLDATDIHTGWTETRASINKAQKHVFNALMHIKGNLPFHMLGIDSDNGSEFINSHLLAYCKKEDICFTRTRPYQKNDNCHVEQKNWSVVRKHMGYHRFEGQVALDLINEYYEKLRLHTNFFMPSTRLLTKTRQGNQIKKTHEAPATPYARLMQNEEIPKSVKDELHETYLSINPIALKQEMADILEKLLEISMPYRID